MLDLRRLVVAMKERGILFSGAMVRAILSGAKTQTRRVSREQPSWTDVSPAWLARCPYGAPGDRLWVRETHARFSVGEGMDRSVPECVAYRATCGEDGSFDYVNTRGEITELKVSKWTPSIFMPRWASRITLEVTEVRVQRVQDISPDDVLAEGVDKRARSAVYPWHVYAVEDYQNLWDSINGDRAPWASNPWVWAVSFRRLP